MITTTELVTAYAIKMYHNLREEAMKMSKNPDMALIYECYYIWKMGLAKLQLSGLMCLTQSAAFGLEQGAIIMLQ